MGLQKYRADKAGETEKSGGTPWYANWMGGPTLALIRNCPTEWGPRTVYVTGDADTWFSVPAACKVRGTTVRGYITSGDNGYEFRPHTEELEKMATSPKGE